MFFQDFSTMNLWWHLFCNVHGIVY